MTTCKTFCIGLSATQVSQKRIFDLFLSSVGLFLFWWLILLAWFIATLETRSNGFFFSTEWDKTEDFSEL